MVISGSVLVLTFWPVVREDTKAMAVATVVTILVLHTLLAVGCKVSELLGLALVIVRRLYQLYRKVAYYQTLYIFCKLG